MDGSLSPQWATAEPTLQIPSVSFEDEGTYECEAENSKGRDTVQGRIIVQGTEPETPPFSLRKQHEKIKRLEGLALARAAKRSERGRCRAQQGHTKSTCLSRDLVAKAVTGTITECQLSSVPTSLSLHPRIPTAPSAVMYKYCNLLIPYLMRLRLLPASPGFFSLLLPPQLSLSGSR